MGVVKEIQDFWTALPKSSPLKILIYVLLILIIAFITTIVFKAANGQHVKVFGIEINSIDTFKKEKPLEQKKAQIFQPKLFDSVLKSDTTNKADIKLYKSPKHKKSTLYVGKSETLKPTVKEDNSLKVYNSPGSINVAGKGNTVYVNAEKELTPTGLNMIINKIDSLRKADNIPKTLIITTYSYFNAPLVYNKINEYFSSQGYMVGSGTSMSNGPMVLGFRFNKSSDNSTVGIELGYFK